MLNVHHEILPDYQNAQSVIWQIYNSSKMTGFSIHKVSKTIDTGEILFKEIIPIQFSTDLRTTVIVTNIDLWKQSSFSLRYVLDNFGDFYFNAEAQVPGRKYTTPSFLQYIRIKRNFNRLKS
jgi:methionyl-tRNA formyltransferase